MKRFGPLVVLCLTAGCAVVTQPPKGPIHLNLPKRAALAPQPFVAHQPWTNVIPWVYPPNPETYCWHLQSSSNLVDWVDVPGDCVKDPLYGFATNTAGFWRLKGSTP